MALHSPEEQTISGRTREEALAWCLVWLMAPELGIGPLVGRYRHRTSADRDNHAGTLALAPAWVQHITQDGQSSCG